MICAPFSLSAQQHVARSVPAFIVYPESLKRKNRIDAMTQLYYHARIEMILLANSQQGGLEGEALQEHSFLLLVFASSAGKNEQQKVTVRGLRPPQAWLTSKPAE
jgi:hypothetical protein